MKTLDLLTEYEPLVVKVAQSFPIKHPQFDRADIESEGRVGLYEFLIDPLQEHGNKAHAFNAIRDQVIKFLRDSLPSREFEIPIGDYFDLARLEADE